MDPRETQIREELLRSPPPTYKELSRKYRVALGTISRIKRELGLSTLRESAINNRRLIEQAKKRNPAATQLEIAKEVGLSQSTVANYLREQQRAEPDTHDWIWPRVHDLRTWMLQVVEHLRNAEYLASSLNHVEELVETLKPYQPWSRWYSPADRGHGSLALMLAERANLEPDDLARRIRYSMEVSQRLENLLNLVTGNQHEMEVHTNGHHGEH